MWLLNVRSNDAEFIGFFCACVTVSTPFAAFGMVIGAGVYPELAKAFARGDRASLRSIVAHAARVLVLVIALTAALGAVRGPDAARLLSEAEGAGTVLVAVVLGQTCLGGLLFFLDVLAARGALRCRFRLVLGLAIAHVIGTSALLRSVGPEGAALAILLSSAVGFGATAWLTRGAVGPFLPWRCVTRAVVAAAATAALVALFPRPGGVGALLAQLAAGVGVYLLCLWGAGERWQTGNRP